MDTPPVGTVNPLLLGIPHAAELLGISERQVKYELADGRIRSLKVGKRRLIPVSALHSFIEDRLAETDDAPRCRENALCLQGRCPVAGQRAPVSYQGGWRGS
jgi:excisionase family DNA binding protein